MTVDTSKSLITYIYDRLTTDATFKTLMGGTVRLYLDFAEPDAEFPYLVQRLDIRKEPGTFVIQKATHYLDIWSDSPNADELLSIRERLIQLLDELVFSTSDVGSVHIGFLFSGGVPEPEQGIWHYATMWDWIFRRDSEATSIEGR